MADYIACLNASGNNKKEVIDFIKQSSKAGGSVSASAKGSGVVVKGEGDVRGRADKDAETIKKLETRYFEGGASICHDVLKTYLSLNKTRKYEYLKKIAKNTQEIADNTPRTISPVIDCSEEMAQQLQLYPGDSVVIVGMEKAISRLVLGKLDTPFLNSDQNAKSFTVWGRAGEPVVPIFYGADGSILKEGHIKLKIYFTDDKEKKRDLHQKELDRPESKK